MNDGPNVFREGVRGLHYQLYVGPQSFRDRREDRAMVSGR
jgi:hypothetical protein